MAINYTNWWPILHGSPQAPTSVSRSLTRPSNRSTVEPQNHHEPKHRDSSEWRFQRSQSTPNVSRSNTADLHRSWKNLAETSRKPNPNREKSRKRRKSTCPKSKLLKKPRKLKKPRAKVTKKKLWKLQMQRHRSLRAWALQLTACRHAVPRGAPAMTQVQLVKQRERLGTNVTHGYGWWRVG